MARVCGGPCQPLKVPPLQEEAPLGLVIEEDEKPRPPSPVSISSGEESADSSPSPSDNSTDGYDLVGVWSDPTMAEHMNWIVQGKKVHIVQRPVPWCRP